MSIATRMGVDPMAILIGFGLMAVFMLIMAALSLAKVVIGERRFREYLRACKRAEEKKGSPDA